MSASNTNSSAKMGPFGMHEKHVSDTLRLASNNDKIINFLKPSKMNENHMMAEKKNNPRKNRSKT